MATLRKSLQTFATPTSVQHPLDPLTHEDIEGAVALCGLNATSAKGSDSKRWS